MDESYKVAITRLGDRIRVGGTAEISGYSDKLDPARRATLDHSLTDLFPRGGDIGKATFWSGLRPMTPDGPPVIGATRYANLHLNTGHGTLGWTMACGSGRVLADMLSGRKPDIDVSELALTQIRSPVWVRDGTKPLNARCEERSDDWTSLQLHACFVHDLAPARDFRVHHRGEGRRRVTSGTSEPLRSQASLIAAICMAGCNSLIMRSTMPAVCSSERTDHTRSPLHNRQACFRGGGKIGERRHPLWRGDRERAQLPGPDRRRRRAHAVEHHRHVAGDQVLHRRPGPAIGDVLELVLVRILNSSPAR